MRGSLDSTIGLPSASSVGGSPAQRHAPDPASKSNLRRGTNGSNFGTEEKKRSGAGVLGMGYFTADGILPITNRYSPRPERPMAAPVSKGEILPPRVSRR